MEPEDVITAEEIKAGLDSAFGKLDDEIEEEPIVQAEEPEETEEAPVEDDSDRLASKVIEKIQQQIAQAQVAEEVVPEEEELPDYSDNPTLEEVEARAAQIAHRQLRAMQLVQNEVSAEVATLEAQYDIPAELKAHLNTWVQNLPTNAFRKGLGSEGVAAVLLHGIKTGQIKPKGTKSVVKAVGSENKVSAAASGGRVMDSTEKVELNAFKNAFGRHLDDKDIADIFKTRS